MGWQTRRRAFPRPAARNPCAAGRTEPPAPSRPGAVPMTTESTATSAPTPELPPLRSMHTSNFGPLLGELGLPLLVTTYQAGKLVVLRQNDEDTLNTHFRAFPRPMGLAVAGDRLALGTALEVWEYHNLPAVARNLEPAGSHDACFLPRSAHVTGDVQIHEMAWAGRPGQGEPE